MQSGPSSVSPATAALEAQLEQRLAEYGFAELPESELPAVRGAWGAIVEHATLLTERKTRTGS